jgi:hypothetical protein
MVPLLSRSPGASSPYEDFQEQAKKTLSIRLEGRLEFST